MSARRDAPSGPLFQRYWLPVIGYIVLISVLSHQPRLAPPPIPFFPSDKAAHLIEFGLFGWLLWRAWRATFGRSNPALVAMAALSCAVFMGTIDEIHQSFVPGRDSSPYDLFADAAGATIAQIILMSRTRG